MDQDLIKIYCDKRLTYSDAKVFFAINFFRKKEQFKVSRQYIADLVAIQSMAQVTKSIKKLTDLGYIHSTKNTPQSTKSTPQSTKNTPQSTKNTPQSTFLENSDNNNNNNNINNINNNNINNNNYINNINKKEKEKEKEKEKDTAKKIIDYLNKKLHELNPHTAIKYRHTARKSLSCIHARLAEGYMLDDFIRAIDNQILVWGKDDVMVQYLRPETLFGPKMENYVNNLRANQIKIQATKTKKETPKIASSWQDFIAGQLA